MRYLFNPALLGFLVVLATLNLMLNLLVQLGAVGPEYLGRASEVVAIGFAVALIYTAIFERRKP
jgi:hypothetical protein